MRKRVKSVFRQEAIMETKDRQNIVYKDDKVPEQVLCLAGQRPKYGSDADNAQITDKLGVIYEARE